MPGRQFYRRDALIRSAQPEALDDLLRVTAPHERVFAGMLVAAVLFVLGLGAWMAATI